MRILKGTGIEVATDPVDVEIVIEADDSRRRHHSLNPKMTVDLVKGFQISPQDLAQNAVKGLLIKMLLCLPHQCFHPPSPPQSPRPPTSHQ